jgi:hypothetical protein
VNIRCDDDEAAEQVLDVLIDAGLSGNDYSRHGPYVGSKGIQINVRVPLEEETIAWLRDIEGVTITES